LPLVRGKLPIKLADRGILGRLALRLGLGRSFPSVKELAAAEIGDDVLGWGLFGP
jgi:hypothetical protein